MAKYFPCLDAGLLGAARGLDVASSPHLPDVPLVVLEDGREVHQRVLVDVGLDPGGHLGVQGLETGQILALVAFSFRSV